MWDEGWRCPTKDIDTNKPFGEDHFSWHCCCGTSHWCCSGQRHDLTGCNSNCLNQVVHPSNAMVCWRLHAQLNVSSILVKLVFVAVVFCQLTCPPTKVLWGQSGFQPEGAHRHKIFATLHPKKICWKLTFTSASNLHPINSTCIVRCCRCPRPQKTVIGRLLCHAFPPTFST